MTRLSFPRPTFFGFAPWRIRLSLFCHIVCWVNAFLFALVSPLEAQQTLPYEATVSTTSAIVHAAPSQHAYATDRLPRGSVVEVYRLDPGGWCAVRPPEGSFSLIPLDALIATDDPHVAQIARSGVKCWVGTRIENREEPLWQVRLEQGELVELLKSWDELQTADGWALVAPPAGEFRWIHERELQRETAPESVIVADAPRGLPIASRAAPEPSPPVATEPQSTLATETPSAAPSTEQEPVADVATVNRESEESQAPAIADSSDSPPNHGGWRRVDSPAVAVDSNDSAPSSQPTTSPRTVTTGSLSFEDRLSRAQNWFDHQLSGEPAVEPAVLKKELETLAVEARGSRERQRLEELSSRFGRWEDLELRRQALQRLQAAGSSEQTSPRMNPSTQEQPRSTTSPFEASMASLTQFLNNDSNSGVDPTAFAAQGTLTRLIRDGGQRASSYAVQDSTGKVIALVVPSPGVNLERYLRKEVGIQGASSPNPTLSLPTVIAERVVELDRR